LPAWLEIRTFAEKITIAAGGPILFASLAKSLRNLNCSIVATFLAPTLSIPILAQAPPAPAAANKFVVVLDAAHGGDETGGRITHQDGSSQQEKAYTLALSIRLRSLLGARGISVVTTREQDATVNNDSRAAIANRANARACLSLHASESGSGIHLFVSSLAPAEQGQLSPWKTAQAAYITRSLALAGVINSALDHAGITVTLGRTALPVIDSMACPAIAVEVAPQLVAGQAQPTNIDDAGYEANVAEALAAAIVQWRSGPPTEAPQP
jgi:N-acetylmuramoyl-L-alanine amidase